MNIFTGFLIIYVKTCFRFSHWNKFILVELFSSNELIDLFYNPWISEIHDFQVFFKRVMRLSHPLLEK